MGERRWGREGRQADRVATGKEGDGRGADNNPVRPSIHPSGRLLFLSLVSRLPPLSLCRSSVSLAGSKLNLLLSLSKGIISLLLLATRGSTAFSDIVLGRCNTAGRDWPAERGLEDALAASEEQLQTPDCVACIRVGNLSDSSRRSNASWSNPLSMY